MLTRITAKRTPLVVKIKGTACALENVAGLPARSSVAWSVAFMTSLTQKASVGSLPSVKVEQLGEFLGVDRVWNEMDRAIGEDRVDSARMVARYSLTRRWIDRQRHLADIQISWLSPMNAGVGDLHEQDRPARVLEVGKLARFGSGPRGVRADSRNVACQCGRWFGAMTVDWTIEKDEWRCCPFRVVRAVPRLIAADLLGEVVLIQERKNIRTRQL